MDIFYAMVGHVLGYVECMCMWNADHCKVFAGSLQGGIAGSLQGHCRDGCKVRPPRMALVSFEHLRMPLVGFEHLRMSLVSFEPQRMPLGSSDSLGRVTC